MIRRAPYPLPPKRQRVRSEIPRGPKRVWLRHRKHVRGRHCCVPGCMALDIQFAHIRSAANAGTGLKPHDRYGVPLCVNHHREQHDCGQGSFEDRHGIDLFAIAAELVRTSPDKMMRLFLMLEEDDVFDAQGKRGDRQSASPLTQQGVTTPGNPQGRPAGNVAKSQDDPSRARASSTPARRSISSPIADPRQVEERVRMIDLASGLPRFIPIYGLVR